MNEGILNSSWRLRVAKTLRSNCEAVRIDLAQKIRSTKSRRQQRVSTGSERPGFPRHFRPSSKRSGRYGSRTDLILKLEHRRKLLSIDSGRQQA
jgi:hypothetical protein